MYLDYILLTIGGISAIAAIALGVYLSITKKMFVSYNTEPDGTTEFFDISTMTVALKKEESLQEGLSRPLSIEDATVATDAECSEETEYVDTNVQSVQSSVNENIAFGVKLQALNEKYHLEKEIYGGGMSRIFLATNIKLGNKWIVKYIKNEHGLLANEDNILKRLNHLNLPSIIDIFHDNSGIYLVQSYIEGVSLDAVLKSDAVINQKMLIDWFEQLSKVLSYLHNLEPNPIFHCDLKPSNIIVTHDNNLVLIDFGISKVHGDDNDKNIAVTHKYAAPEQLKHRISEKNKKLIEDRFGELPPERMDWKIDARTDIFSLGIIFFELIVGDIPKKDNFNHLKTRVYKNLSDIIYKCIEIKPDDRYNTINEVLTEIQNAEAAESNVTGKLVMRKVVATAAVILAIVSSGTIASGAYVNQKENSSLLYVSPNVALLSMQQAAQIYIEKQYDNGETTMLEPSQIIWNYGDNNVARVDGTKIAGLNIGETEVFGKYRDKLISVMVNVVEPLDGVVDISLHYKTGNQTRVFAGNDIRETVDGSLESASFTSPESIDINENGVIYVVDAGKIRMIEEDVKTIEFEPDYLTVDKIKCYKDELYVLTNEWEDEDGKFYGIIKLDETGANGIYIADAVYTRIEDFDIKDDGSLYFIESNGGTLEKYLKKLNMETYEPETLTELPQGSKSLCIDNTIYISDVETATIFQFNENTNNINYLAGLENNKHFVDGELPMFYEPFRIHMQDDNIYVLDFNILRVINTKNGVLNRVYTIAGEVSTETNPKTISGDADKAVFAHSSLADFIVQDENKILLTDPKNNVIREILIDIDGS